MTRKIGNSCGCITDNLLPGTDNASCGKISIKALSTELADLLFQIHDGSGLFEVDPTILTLSYANLKAINQAMLRVPNWVNSRPVLVEAI